MPEIYPLDAGSAYVDVMLHNQHLTSTSVSASTESGTHQDVLEGDLDSEDVAVLDDNLATIPAPLALPSAYPPLLTPIAIPQIAPGSMMGPPMPFTRAYAPVMSDYGLQEQDFLKIIDTVNICVAASPPLQVLSLAADGIGFVPHEWATAVSVGLSVCAAAGTAATSYFRTRRFLEKVNKEVWEPRGLQMSIAKDADLLSSLGLNLGRVHSHMAAFDSTTGESTPETMSKRRLRALGDQVAKVTFDIAPPENPGNIIDKLSAKQQARAASKQDRRVLKRQQKRERGKRSQGAAFFSNGDPSSTPDHGKSLTKSGHEIEKAKYNYGGKLFLAFSKQIAEMDEDKLENVKDVERKANRNEKRAREQRERQERRKDQRYERDEKREQKREEKEAKKMGKLEWIVIKTFDRQVQV